MWKRLASSFALFFSQALRSPAALTLLLAVCGLVCLFTGLWWIYPPAALIVTGALLLFEAQRIARMASAVGVSPAGKLEPRA